MMPSTAFPIDMSRRSLHIFGALLALVAILASALLAASPASAASEPTAVVAWGDNQHGQLNVPAELEIQDVTAISAGWSHSLALTRDGEVIGWGYNVAGQINVPSFLEGRTVAAVAAGYEHSLALTSDGEVVAWGWNSYGQATVPTSLKRIDADGTVHDDGKTVTNIAAGYGHSLALTSDGEVVAWGFNNNGQATVPTSLKRIDAEPYTTTERL